MIFDQNVPRPLAMRLTDFSISIAARLGWSELRNGLLLNAAEQSGFDVLLTGDKTIGYEQNIAGRNIGVVVMSDNHWKIVREYIPAIVNAIKTVKPGAVLPVYCGRFVGRGPNRER